VLKGKDHADNPGRFLHTAERNGRKLQIVQTKEVKPGSAEIFKILGEVTWLSAHITILFFDKNGIQAIFPRKFLLAYVFKTSQLFTSGG
jgi:hypothetical protein